MPPRQTRIDPRLLATLERAVAVRRENRLRTWQPYPRQMEFFALSKEKREVALIAGTQVGKSDAGAFMAACHATGLYPDWWPGKRFNRPTRGWIAGVTAEDVRDVAQTKLYGTPGSEEDWGTGMVPKATLAAKPTLSHGVSNFYDTVRIRHVSGGISTIGQKAYSQGRLKFQGATLDWVWPDEEAPTDIYGEMLSRLTGDGVLWATFTPLLGYTRLVRRFLSPATEDERRDRGVVKMGLRHAEHFTEAEKRRRLAGYDAHERAARENGEPLLGSGAVFEEVREDDILTRLRLADVPEYWAKLWSIDFGVGTAAGHPFAATLLCWDRDADCVYVMHAIRMKGGIPMTHAASMRLVAPTAPVAWPHDGHQVERGNSGMDMAAIYKAEGLEMLPTHATHSTGNFSTEAGITMMLTRMRLGTFKVAAHLDEWWEEFRAYHREEGKIVKLDDDLMSATRVGVMALRHAKGGAFLGAPDRRTRADMINSPEAMLKRGVDFDVLAPWG